MLKMEQTPVKKIKLKHDLTMIKQSPSVSELTLRELEDSENMNLLHNKNPHILDKRIKFKEEGHIYWIDDISDNTMSSTTLIKKFFSGFDSNRATKYILCSKRHMNDETYKYYKMSKDEILKMWSETGKKAAEIGTYNHLQLELYYNKLKYDETIPELNMFFNYVNSLDKNWEPFRTEMLIFHPILRVTGSIDMIYRDKKDGKFILADWKFCKAIKKNKSNGVGVGGLKHVNNSNYYHYSMQLNLYKRILEEFYGYEVKHMELVCLHNSQKNFKTFKISDMSDEINYILNERKKEMIYKKIDNVNKYNVFNYKIEEETR
jgi:hypothetical protein